MHPAVLRIALVAHSAQRRAALAALLGADFAVVLHTDDLKRAARSPNDLIVVDTAAFEPTNLEGCAVLLLNTDLDGLDPLRRCSPRVWGALEAGADPRAVRAAAHAVARGVIALSPGLDSADPLPPLDDPPEALTARELEVLGLVFEGFANKRVAAELGIAPSTVKYHLEGVYAKLGVRSKAQAVRRALELRLLSV